MLASFTTTGRKKTTSSVFVFWRLRELKSEPRRGMLLTIGIVSSMSLTESSIRPPSTAIWPLFTLMSDSISRIRSCGTRFWTGWFWNAGLGSAMNLTRRVVVGLTFSRMVSSSLICGVTFMTNPTGTVIGVVLVAVVLFWLGPPGTTLTWTLK